MNKLNLKTIFPLFICLVTAFTSYSQTNDFKSWNEFSIEKKINKKIALILEQNLRLENNAKQFNSAITVLGVEYRFNKALKVKGLYRYTGSVDVEDGPEHNSRIYADGIFKHKMSRFTLGYRLRYQLNFEQNTTNRWHYLRNKIALKYDIPKTSLLPYAEYEFYYSLNNPYQNSIERNRYTMGFEYSINKKLTVYSFYRIQIDREYYHKPKNSYILGIGLSIEI